MKAFIIFRDRVSYGRRCVAALQAAGLDVVVADHGSTFPGAVAWLAGLEGQGVTVVRCGGGHPRDLWGRDWFRGLCGGERYVVTDPDVVPSDCCPPDWLDRLGDVLDQHPGRAKAGLGLRIDAIPAHYQRRGQVLAWERQFWGPPVAPGVHDAAIDTTLALHVPLHVQGGHSLAGLRTGPPYLADHLAWHEDFSGLPPDLAWYHENAEPGISFWTLPGRSEWGQVAGREDWR